jgi:hypothetical protein
MSTGKRVCIHRHCPAIAANKCDLRQFQGTHFAAPGLVQKAIRRTQVSDAARTGSSDHVFNDGNERKRNGMWKLLIAGVAGLLFSGEARAQVPQVVGVWELDSSSSKLPAQSQLKSETRSFVQRPDGYVVILVQRVLKDGSPAFIQVVAKNDGKAYPQYTSADLADLQISGATTHDTYSERVTGENTAEVIGKRDGQVTNRGTRRISKDGNSMTIDVVTILPNGQEIPIVLAFRKRQQMSKQ